MQEPTRPWVARAGMLQRRLGRRRLLTIAGASGAAALLAACDAGSSEPSPTAEPETPEVRRPTGWSEDSHGSDAEPNFDIVFPSDRVNRVTFVIEPETWEAMLANMVVLYGPRGSKANPTAGGGGFLPPGTTPEAPERYSGLEFPEENPDWFPVTLQFDGRTWQHAGLRFKGSSSLRGTWQRGSDRLPFKLDFDEFEDDFPEIDNQRFFGFKQISLSNNFGDPTGLRETIAYDVFERAGLVAANTGFWEIFLNRGTGPVSLGLYTAVEVIEDSVVARSFADGDGTLWEADGPAASFAAGTKPQIEDSFEVEAGEDDWAPIAAFYDALHAETRTADPEAWRTGVEGRFDVDAFLEWLAVGSVLSHWDTYGAMTHNYYLYNDPARSRLTWITWDHNFVLARLLARSGDGRPSINRVTFDRANVTRDWPLIRFLLDDAVYRERYIAFLRDLAESVFRADEMEAEVQRLKALVLSHVPADEQSDFRKEADLLAVVTRVRARELQEFVATA